MKNLLDKVSALIATTIADRQMILYNFMIFGSLSQQSIDATKKSLFEEIPNTITIWYDENYVFDEIIIFKSF